MDAWKGGCPHCTCPECQATFRVTCGTVFQGTKIPLQNWFLAISLVLNAKKGLSSYLSSVSKPNPLGLGCRNGKRT